MRRPERTVGYGGSAGCGKTDLLIFHQLYAVDFETQRYKRGEIRASKAWSIFFRRVMPNLKQPIDRALRAFPLIDPGGHWNATDHLWTWSCGAKSQFGGMERPTDFLKYYGAEYTEIDFDELTEFEEEQYDQLDSRLRTSDPALTPYMSVRWGSNPVGAGLVWVRRRFVEVAPPGTTVRFKVNLDDREIVQDQIFLQAYLKDNPTLWADGRYEASLRKNKPHIRRALLQGDWYVSVGAFLSDFWDPGHHICDNHQIPPNVYRFRSCDFGIAGKSGRSGWTSVTWWYMDRDGTLTAYAHLYVAGKSADRVAEQVYEIERYFGDWDEDEGRSMLNMGSVLDAQCFKRTGTSGPTIAEDFWRKGVGFKKSTKDRTNGVAELVRRLDTFVEYEDKGRQRKKPMIRWMRRCEKVIQLLPVIPAHETNPADVKDDAEGSDIFDDTMYACTSRPLRPREKSENNYEDDDEDEFETARWRQRERLASLR